MACAEAIAPSAAELSDGPGGPASAGKLAALFTFSKKDSLLRPGAGAGPPDPSLELRTLVSGKAQIRAFHAS